MADVEEQQQQSEEVSTADIVLGILSHNSAQTIANTIRAGQESLLTHFPDNRGVLVNVDGGSKDGTLELAMQAAIDKKTFLQTAYTPPRLAVAEYGIPGKGDAYQAVFAIAARFGARACAIVDGNIGTFTADWVPLLVAPVLQEEIDLVSPCYLRHKYDGPILNGIIYPLTRALYGKRLRQPIGGDFAFSGKLMEYLTRQPQQDGSSGFSADAWISSRASSGDFRLAQASLGLRTVVQNEPAPEVSTIVADTLGAIFAEMLETASVWQRIRNSEPVPTFGSGCEMTDDDSETPPIDVQPMIDSFRLGFYNLQDIWRLVLSPAALVELKRMGIRTADNFQFDDVLWARVIYDFALAYRLRIMDRNHLLRALTPIYLGWVAAYIVSVRNKTARQAQDRIEELCLAYEMQKGYFISRWRWPDRFNP
jgi:hypothetical protein